MPILLSQQFIFTFEYLQINRQCVVEIIVPINGKFDLLQVI